MLLNLRIFKKRRREEHLRMFCGAIETEHNLHREKEARRRDREHLEHRERIHSESPRENFKYSEP